MLSVAEQRVMRRRFARLGTRGRRGARSCPNLRVDVVLAPHVDAYDPRRTAYKAERVK